MPKDAVKVHEYTKQATGLLLLLVKIFQPVRKPNIELQKIKELKQLFELNSQPLRGWQPNVERSYPVDTIREIESSDRNSLQPPQHIFT